MSVKFESIRFGTIEIEADDVIEFPFGLIGLGGLRYALIDRNPGTGFLWLHAVDEPALALPVVSPHQFFSGFELEIAPEDATIALPAARSSQNPTMALVHKRTKMIKKSGQCLTTPDRTTAASIIQGIGPQK